MAHRQTLNEPYWVVNDIYTVSTCDLEDLFLPPRLRVVDEVVRPGVFLDGIELCL